MSNLNQPTGGDDPRPEEAEWTPARGMIRAAWRGGVVAIVAILLSLPVAKYAPPLLSVIWMQVALGFGLTWILLGVVQNAAGMVGWPCTAMGCGLTLLVVVAQRAAILLFAMPAGGSTVDAILGGVLSMIFGYPMFIGLIFAAVLCHRGSPGMGFLSDLLMSNPLFPGGR